MALYWDISWQDGLESCEWSWLVESFSKGSSFLNSWPRYAQIGFVGLYVCKKASLKPHSYATHTRTNRQTGKHRFFVLFAWLWRTPWWLKLALASCTMGELQCGWERYGYGGYGHGRIGEIGEPGSGWISDVPGYCHSCWHSGAIRETHH